MTAGDRDAAGERREPGTRGEPPRGIVVHGPVTGQGAAAEGILRALPGWFGIEAAIRDYARAADEHPTFVATAEVAPASGRPSAGAGERIAETIGFLTLRPTSDYAVEVQVIAVHPSWHRKSAGRALVERAAAYARAEGFELLHVKTLAASDPDAGYAATRAFYLAMGFRPLEVLPQVWGPENPCLLLVRVL